MSTVSTEGLERKDVLKALYNAAKPQGMGFLQYQPGDMSDEMADNVLGTNYLYFDYVGGRVMKVDLNDESGFDPRLFDRDNGEGCAQRVIDALRAGDSAAISNIHETNTEASRIRTRERLDEPSGFEVKGGVPTFTLGLGDAADELKKRL